MSLGLPALRPSAARAQAARGDVPRRQQLGDGLHVLTAAGSNVLALTGVDGTALVDGASAGVSAALLEAVAALPGAGAIHTLFNTHWHPEQTGLNETLGQAGATIIAQENTRLWLTTDVTWPWSHETVQPLPKGARPNKTFYSRGELAVGGKHNRVRTSARLPAHRRRHVRLPPRCQRARRGRRAVRGRLAAARLVDRRLDRRSRRRAPASAEDRERRHADRPGPRPGAHAGPSYSANTRCTTSSGNGSRSCCTRGEGPTKPSPRIRPKSSTRRWATRTSSWRVRSEVYGPISRPMR